MNKYDYGLLFILFVILIIFYYIIINNKDLVYNRTDINALLNKKQSIILEFIEIIVLIIVIILLYNQKKYILAIAFLGVFIEHIRQILFCYRQTLDSLHVITLLLYIIFGIYSYYIKCYWIIYIFFIGSLFHIISLIYKRPLLDIVSIKDILVFEKI